MADPQPLKEGSTAIASTRTHPISDVTEVVLKNGIKIALKSTNFLDDQVLMRHVASKVDYRKYRRRNTKTRSLLVQSLANWVCLDIDRKFSPTPWRVKESTWFQTLARINDPSLETSPDHIDAFCTLHASHLFQQRGKSVQRARFGSFARNATRGGEECKKRSDESFRGNPTRFDLR